MKVKSNTAGSSKAAKSRTRADVRARRRNFGIKATIIIEISEILIMKKKKKKKT